jgi:hypothetical protein
MTPAVVARLNPGRVRVCVSLPLCSVNTISADQLQILSPNKQAGLAASGRAVFFGAGHLSVNVKVCSAEKVRDVYHDHCQR